MLRALVVAGASLIGLALAWPGLAAGHTVQAVDYQFIAPGGGSSLTVTVGDQVTWEAAGDPHTVTSGTPGAIDNRFPDRPAAEGFLLAGTSFTTTFAAPGTFPYFCEVHFETMTGTVIVVAATTPAPTKAPTLAPTPAPTPRPTPRPTPAPTPQPTQPPTPAATSTPQASTSPSPDSSAPGSPSPAPSPSETSIGSPTAVATAAPSGGSGAPASGDGPGLLLVAIVALAAAGLAGGLLLARRRRGSGAAG
jgi:plastocyanin